MAFIFVTYTLSSCKKKAYLCSAKNIYHTLLFERNENTAELDLSDTGTSGRNVCSFQLFEAR